MSRTFVISALMGILAFSLGMSGGTCNVDVGDVDVDVNQSGGGGDPDNGNDGCNGSDAGAGGPIIAADDHIIGDPSATVTVVEYEDFQ